MRVLVHAAGLSRGGGFRHLEGLLPALASALPEEARVVFCVRASVADALAPSSGSVQFVRIDDALARSPLARVAFDNVAIPLLARQHRADVLVSLGNFGPAIARVPHVVFQTNATFFLPMTGASRAARARLAMRRALAVRTMRGADRIVTPSAAMAAIVRHDVGDLGQPFEVLLHAIARDRFPFVARPHDRRPFVFFCPNVAAPYKGLDVVVAALPDLVRGDVVVRAYGNTGDWPEGLGEARAKAAALGLTDRFTLEEELSGDAMPAAYERADALLHSTRCESFGFSLIEALSTGLPVVASDIPVNREIAGDAAVYYQATSAADLARAAATVAGDAALRQTLAARARARLDTFDWSWERYARDFWSICERTAR